MIAAGLVLCYALLAPRQQPLRVCERASASVCYLSSPPLLRSSSPMLKKEGEKKQKGAIKRRLFCHWQRACRCTPLSPSFCLHARVLQSWNGKFLAAFGVKFAGSAVKCAVSRTLHYALTRDDVFMRQLCKNLWFSGREANLEKWPMRSTTGRGLRPRVGASSHKASGYTT